MAEVTQYEVDSLRGELREERGVVEALEESKASAEAILSKKIAALSKLSIEHDQLKKDMDRLLEAIDTHREFNVATSEDFAGYRSSDVPLDAFSPIDRPLYTLAQELEAGKKEKTDG